MFLHSRKERENVVGKRETQFFSLGDLFLGNTKTKKKFLDANAASADLYYFDDINSKPWSHKLKTMVNKLFLITTIVYLIIVLIQASGRLSVEYRGLLAILEVGLSIFISYRFAYLGMSISVVTNAIASVHFFRSSMLLSGYIFKNAHQIPDNMMYGASFAPPLLINLAFMRISLVVVSVLVAYISTQNSKQIHKLERIAFIDGLTGLYNHRYFHTLIEEKIEVADSRNSSLGMIMIDIDNFKNFNNTHGRNEGDRLLVKTAQVLFNESKKSDVVSRYGGDDFAVLISETNKNDILWVIERIKKSYKEMTEMQRFPEDTTISIGYSIYPDFANNKEDLITQANSALYQAKNKGKNNVQLYRNIFKEIRAFFNSDENQLFGGIMVLLSTVYAKDRYTFNHSERVMEYSVKTGEALGFDENRLRELKIAALLHDIGKVEVPEEILNKSEPLTGSERSLLRQHPNYSINILEPLADKKSLIDTIKYHHERYDGKGYPHGIKGDEIPLEARILCVADAYDAMLSNRPYRKGMKKEEAIEELLAKSGTQFDPLIVDTFINILLNEKN